MCLPQEYKLNIDTNSSNYNIYYLLRDLFNKTQELIHIPSNTRLDTSRRNRITSQGGRYIEILIYNTHLTYYSSMVYNHQLHFEGHQLLVKLLYIPVSQNKSCVLSYDSHVTYHFISM